MKERIERLDQYMKVKQLNDNQVTVMCGLSNGLLNKARAGKTDIGLNAISKITTKYTDLSKDWLLTGEGDMLRDEAGVVNKNGEKEYTLPLLPIDVMAGKPMGDIDSITLAQCEQYIVPELIYHGAQMLIRVSGDSMLPRYRNGDILAIKQLLPSSFIQWGKPYVLDTEQGALVKRLFECKKDPTHYIICRSDNHSKYPDMAIQRRYIRNYYIVIGVISIE